MFDRWSKSVEHCQLDCMLPGFTQLMWQCQKTTSPCSLGVPECGLHPAVLPSSHPPPRSAFLDHSSSCLLQHYRTTKLERGGMLYDMSHINRLRGGAAVLVCTRTHILSYCTLLSMQLPLPHILTHRHTHAHTYTKRCRPPVVALATLRQIQTFPLKAEPKPTTIVCCWILRGAFRSCQFVQVRIKKTSWPT